MMTRSWAVFAISMTLAFAAEAKTIYVSADSTSPASPYASWEAAAQDVQSAIDVAKSGDTILVHSGTYKLAETLMLTNSFSALTIKSDNGSGTVDPEGTVLDGQSKVRIMDWRQTAQGVKIEGLTFENGYAASDAVYANIVQGGRFEYNIATNACGGAIWFSGKGNGSDNGNYGVDCAVKNCRFKNNTALRVGGAIAIGRPVALMVESASNGDSFCRVKFFDCEFSNNTAHEPYPWYAEQSYPHGGGAVFCWSKQTNRGAAPSFSNCTFTANLSCQGAIGQRGPMLLQDCVFKDNVGRNTNSTETITCPNGVKIPKITGTDTELQLADHCLATIEGNGFNGDQDSSSLCYSVICENCVFAGNDGQMVLPANSSKFTDCLVYGNKGKTLCGSHIYTVDTAADMYYAFCNRCVISNNTVNTLMMNDSNGRSRTFRQCLITGNTFSEHFLEYTSDMAGTKVFENCTVADNHWQRFLFGKSFASTTPQRKLVINNSIFWNNTETITVKTNPLTDLAISGANNLTDVAMLKNELPDGLVTLPPCFVDGYELSDHSPARDVGALLSWQDATTLDLAGNLRVVSTTGVPYATDPTALPDLGVFECQTPYVSVPVIFITAGSTNRVYNGEALTDATYTVAYSNGTLAAGHELAGIATSGTITHTGTVANVIASGYMVKDSGGSDVSDQYIIATEPGELTVTPLAVNVTIHGNCITNVYDGTAHAVSGFNVSADSNLFNPALVSYSGSASTSQTDAGKAQLVYWPTEFSLVGEYAGDFAATFTTVNGESVVTKAKLSLASESQHWQYDGDAHSNTNVTATGFVTGEGATYSDFPSVTDVSEGEVTNEFTYVFNANTKPGNYDVASTYGVIQITAADAVIVKIYGNASTNVYDGTKRVSENYTWKSDSSLVAETDFALKSGVEASASGTDADTYTMGLTSDSFESKTKNFEKINFEVFDGELVITKTPLSLTSGTQSWQYNGNAHSNTTVSVTGFVDGEGATYSGFPTVTEVSEGEVSNTFNYTLNANTKAGNYDITTTYGVIQITAADAVTVKIRGNALTNGYNAAEQSVSGYAWESASSLVVETDFALKSGVEASASGTDADTYKMNLTSDSFESKTDKFKAIHFDITDGELVVTQLLVTVTAPDASMRKGKDMPDLSKKKATIEGTLPGEEELISYSLSFDKDYKTYPVGVYPDAVVASGDASQGNYLVTFTNGTLTIVTAKVVINGSIKWGGDFVWKTGTYYGAVTMWLEDGDTDSIDEVYFAFADRPASEPGLYSAQYWNSYDESGSYDPKPVQQTLTLNGTEYRVRYWTGDFSEFGGGTNLVWGNEKATKVAEIKGHPFELYTRRRVSPVTGNETAAEVDNFQGWLVCVSCDYEETNAVALVANGAAKQLSALKFSAPVSVAAVNRSLALGVAVTDDSDPECRISSFAVEDGVIKGAVTVGTDGVPGANAEVTLYGSASLDGEFTLLGAVTTDDSGTFTFGDPGTARFFRVKIETTAALVE